MAATWPLSRVPFLDENGDPMVGAKLYFYDAGTTTPQQVYSDAALANVIAQPILANARGMFQIIFLNATPGSYRQKMLEADDTLVFDDDGISVPQNADYVPPDTGDTDVTLLMRTGFYQPFHGTSAPSGWVRAAGRTIGSATSGASERANADCENLFLHLWTVDSTIAVSGGRGGTAAGDWAANKALTLPDLRERALAGLATMGNADAGLIADALIDSSETTSILGATGGLGSVTLAVTELPSHNHGGSTGSAGAHNHANGSYNRLLKLSSGSDTAADLNADAGEPDVHTSAIMTDAPNHTHTISSQGGGAAHTNLQPSMFVTILIKL